MKAAEQEIYDEALKYATEKHEGQKRKDGVPYIMHPVAVSEIVREWGYGLEYQVTALFHDLLEDTDAEESEIERIGGPAVLKAVRLLTKTEGYVMSEYVDGIRKDPIAFRVKAADRLHNLRCAVNTDDEFKRRYIYETIDWYLDFSPEIPKQVKALSETVDLPLNERDFDYGTGTEWTE